MCGSILSATPTVLNGNVRLGCKRLFSISNKNTAHSTECTTLATVLQIINCSVAMCVVTQPHVLSPVLSRPRSASSDSRQSACSHGVSTVTCCSLGHCYKPTTQDKVSAFFHDSLVSGEGMHKGWGCSRMGYPGKLIHMWTTNHL